MKKLFVGGLPWSYTDEQLAELFAPHGEVISARIARERGTDRSRGFGFVELEDSAADAAKEALDGQDVGGRNIKIDFANPPQAREDRGPRGGYDARRSGGNFGGGASRGGSSGGYRGGNSGGSGGYNNNRGGGDYGGSSYSA